MTRIFFSVLLLAAIMTACNKRDEWLDERYNMADVVPETLSDFQQLLDNVDLVNNYSMNLGLMATDNYYVLDADLPRLQPLERNSYLWAKDIYESARGSSWAEAYTNVEIANIVLDGLAKIKDGTGTAEYRQLRGSALFYRAYNFFGLVNTFAKPYTAANTGEPGIVLRTTSDVNVGSVRATLGASYDKIIQDLNEAVDLLPNEGIKPTRPSKAAAYAMLAKTYLSMQEYGKTEEFATKALAIRSTLLDFNTVTPAFFPFVTYIYNNPEYLIFGRSSSFPIFSPLGTSLTDTLLFKSYEPADLRKTLFYTDMGTPAVPKIYFKGSYTVGIPFGGLGTNEVLLIKAEAQVRQNKLSEGMETLNTLRRARYTPAGYADKTAATVVEGVKMIIEEKRRELPFTGQVRWEDLRRLNLDPQYAVTLQRIVNGTTVSLPPNDPRYVLPIPDEEIRLSGLEQNER